MTVDATPGVGLNFGYLTGSSGWGDGLNYNFLLVDAVTSPFVRSVTQATPPSLPVDGDRYLVPVGATGLWSDQVGKQALWYKGAWIYFQPRKGWLVRAWDTSKVYRYDGTVWEEYIDQITPDILDDLTAAIAAADEAQQSAAQVEIDRAAVAADKVAADQSCGQAASAASDALAQKNAAQNAAQIATTARNDASAAKDIAAAKAQESTYAAQSANQILTAITAATGAGGVGYIASGTGAVQTTIQDKCRTFVSDGDYATAQNAAIAAIGKAFFVPVSTSITITVPSDAATLNAAIAGIARWVIPASSSVTILVPSLSLSAPTVFSHPYGSRVFISGSVPKVTTTASAAGSVTGAAGAWEVPLTVASATGISANDYAIVSAVTGTGAFRQFFGLCKVLSVVGNTVTVINTNKTASWATADLTSANIAVVKNIISYTGCDGFQVDSALGGLLNLVLVGNKTPGTIGLITNRMSMGGKGAGYVFCGAAYGTGISGFGDGGVYSQYGGTVDGAYLAVADCLIYNVYSQHGGKIIMNDGISTGCAESGLSSSNSGDVSFERGNSHGNGTYGIFTFAGGSVLAKGAYTWCNASDGWRTAWGGALRADTIDARYNGGCGGFNVGGSAIVPGAIASYNVASGITTEGGGSVYAVGMTASNNGAFGVYNDGSVFNAPSTVVSNNAVNGITTTNGGVSLCDLISGTGNTTYLASASNGGYMRATNASAAGATIYANNQGFIDITGATGSPTLTTGAGGKALTSAGALQWGTISNVAASTITASVSMLVGGATGTTLFQVKKDCIYNSEGSAAFSFQNATSPLKMLVGGYDGTRDYAYFQSVNSTSGYKPLALNPNSGNVGIGLGTSSPTARLHLPAGAAGAGNGPLKMSPGPLLTVPDNGVIEYDGTNMYFTTGGTRKTVNLT
jgi:Protein of unknown function (DUF2793)